MIRKINFASINFHEVSFPVTLHKMKFIVKAAGVKSFQVKAKKHQCFIEGTFIAECAVDCGG